jgi:outer membrane protein assembly factor BamB
LGPWHGFVLGYDQKTLMLKYQHNTNPGGAQCSVWQSGTGLVGDGNAVWEVVANGGGPLAFSVTQLIPSGTSLMVGHSYKEPTGGDLDLAGGPLLIDGHILAGGKSKAFFMLDATTGALQTHSAIGGECHNMAAWDGGSQGVFAYTWGDGTSLYQYTIAGGAMTLKGQSPGPMSGHPGGQIQISSNGTMPGTAVAWANVAMCGSAWKTKCAGALYAWDATDVTKGSLWHSTDTHYYAKHSPPTVANGRVYVLTWPDNTGAATPTLLMYGM